VEATERIEQKTSVPNPVYDTVSVMYHALQGAETCERYVADAEQRGDHELAGFFRNVDIQYCEVARVAKGLLRARLEV
jgi:hypothetical protein